MTATQTITNILVEQAMKPIRKGEAMIKQFIENSIAINTEFANNRSKYLASDIDEVRARMNAGDFQNPADMIPTIITDLAQLENTLQKLATHTETLKVINEYEAIKAIKGGE